MMAQQRDKLEDRQQRVRFEADKWDKYFGDALAGEGQEHENSLWWRISDDDSLHIVREFVSQDRPVAICEPACGSGGTSALLAREFAVSELTLLDISPRALGFAASVLPAELRRRTRLIEGDAFAMPLEADRFDLTWNVGVIEHYSRAQIVDMVEEMLRITRPGGTVMVALPNRSSIATLKAALLGSGFGRRWLGAVPGYRFDSEILYGTHDLARMLGTRFGRLVYIRYAGNALWVGAPEPWVRLAHSIAPRSRLSFLAFLILRK
jgi:SAM-dependent methyltransferase